MNLFMKQKQTHRHRKQTYGYLGEVGVGGVNCEIRADIYTLLTIYKININMKYITNRDLLCTPGNSTEYSVVAYMEKNLKNSGYLYVCN